MGRRISLTSIALLLLSTFAIASVPGARANVFAVPDGDIGELNLALDLANQNGGTVVLAENGEYVLTTVHNINDGPNGLYQITGDVVIEGNGATIRRDSADNFRIFMVASNGTLHLQDLTIRNGRVLNGTIDSTFTWGGGILNQGILTLDNVTISSNLAFNGGGIFNLGNLTATGVTVSQNTASFGGGGIHTRGEMLMTDSYVLGNTVSGGLAFGGGGIYSILFADTTLVNTVVHDNTVSPTFGYGFGGGILSGGTVSSLTLIDSVVSDNTIEGYGGGIYTSAELTVSGSQISGNSTGLSHSFVRGGGIYADQPSVATIVNSTISGNDAVGGGGVASDGEITIHNSTVSGNTAVTAGGGGLMNGSGSMELAASIVAGNTATAGPGPDIAGVVTADGGYNLVGDGSGTNLVNGVDGNIVGIDPALVLDPAGLQDNGGPTETIALVDDPSNPAVDAIPSGVAGCGDPIDRDQRGGVRPHGAGCDIGAFELGAEIVDPNLPTPPVLSDVPGDFTAEATGPGGALVTFDSPTAVDQNGNIVDVTCDPESGSSFPLGETTVTCEATDDDGRSSEATFTVTVEDTTPPGLTVPGNLTVNATSPAGAAVTFQASAVDLVDGVVAVTCSPASGALFPTGQTIVTCEANDTAGNRAEESFSVTVLGAGDQLGGVVTGVEGMNLGQGTTQSLLASLTAAQASIDAGDIATACNQLSAAANKIQAQRGKQLTVAEADQLLAEIAQIRAALGC